MPVLSSYLEWQRFSSRPRSEHQLHQLPIMWTWATRLVFQSLSYGDFVRVKWFPCMKMLSTHSRCSMAVFFWSFFKKNSLKNAFGFWCSQGILMFTSALRLRTICSCVTSFFAPSSVSLLSSPFLTLWSFHLAFSSSFLLPFRTLCLLPFRFSNYFLRLLGERQVGHREKRKKHSVERE